MSFMQTTAPRPTHQPWAGAGATRRFPGDDDDEEEDRGFDIPLRIRPINSNMDRLLYGAAAPPPGPPGGMPARLNYGFGMGGGGGGGGNFGGWGGAAGGAGGGGGNFAAGSWGGTAAPPVQPPASTVPRGMAGQGQDEIVSGMARMSTGAGAGAGRARQGGGAVGGARTRTRTQGLDEDLIERSAAGDDSDDGEDDAEEEVPLKLKSGRPSAFDALLATTSTNTKTPPPLDPTTPTPAASAPVIGSTSPIPENLRFPSTTPRRSTATTPAHWDDPPQSPREQPITPRPVPPPLDLSLADLPCSDDDDEDDEDDDHHHTTQLAPGGSTPAPNRQPQQGQPDRKPYKARGQTPNRRLTIAELESLPDKELLAQALMALGYRSRRDDEEEEEDEEEEDEEGGEVEKEKQFNNEFASRGGGIPGMGAGTGHHHNRHHGGFRPGWGAADDDGDGEREPVAGGVKLKKGRNNFGMAWGMV